MNSRKKQTVAVAMATALGASAMMSPVAVHAQEEDPATVITQESTQEVKPEDATPVSEQGLPASEQPQELNTDSLSSGKPIIQSRANVAFTDYAEARQAIETALADYPVSNATTQQEIEDFLNKKFVDTGKLKNIYVVVISKNDADTDSTGTIEIKVAPSPVVSGTQFPNGPQFLTFLIIPRLPKTGEIAIDSTNFPDDVFRQYVSDNCDDDNDDVLSVDEISKATSIVIINNSNVKSLEGIEHFTALTRLDCHNTGIDSLDVSNNTDLQELYCHNTGIGSLNVSNNPDLQELYCYNTGIQTLDVSNNTDLINLNCFNTGIQTLDVSKNTDLIYLDCFNTGIQMLDVSNNKDLQTLGCYNTGIQMLDVSNNTALERLYCYNTGISSLDVSNNSDLQALDCSNTGIQTLDVSKNGKLGSLECFNTKIQSLDVSNNTALTYLNCSNTPLACLNLGTGYNFYQKFHIPKTSNIDLAVTSDSFDMTQAFPDIDISKVKNIKGAVLNSNIITGYTLGKPITYTYDCGTANGNPVTLDVTLNPHKTDSEIQITGTLDTTYTGKPIDNPSVKTTGSTGAVTFTYEKWTGTGWEVVNDMPTDAGRYTVQAHLDGNDYYNEAVSEKKEFTITQATNSWKNELAVADWTYGGQPSIPTATAKFGNPIFTYSDSKTGTFTSDVPVNAGTWYVKATVAGTNNYTGLESIHAFTILPKNIKDGNITVSDINSDNDVKKLSVKDGDRELVKGTAYDVETKKAGNKKTVIITFKGNYAGTIERTYTVATSQPEKPEQKPQQDKPQEKPKDTDSVKTGDSTQTGLLATLGVLSVGCIAFLTGKRRKGKKD